MTVNLTGNLLELGSPKDIKMNSIGNKNNGDFNKTLETFSSKESQKYSDKGNIQNEKPFSKEVPQYKPISENKKINNEINGQEELSQNDLQENVNDVVKEVVGFIKNKFNLNNDEIAMILLANSFVPVDLLELNNFTKILLDLNGIEDISQVFVDGDLSQNVLTMLEEYKQIIDELPNSILTESIDFSPMDFMDILNVTDSIVADEITDFKNNIRDHSHELDSEPGYKTDIHSDASRQGDLLEIINEASISQSDNYDDNNHALDDEHNDNTILWNNIVDNIAKSITNQDINEVNQIDSSNVNMVEIVDQIVDKIKIVIKPEIKSMELQLNPEHLGKVNLTVAQKNGVMTAEFLVQNQLTKEAIETQIGVLIDNLDKQGLKVEKVEVAIANFEFRQREDSSSNDFNSNSNRGSSRRRNRNINLNEIDTVSENELESDGISGVNVNYTA